MASIRLSFPFGDTGKVCVHVVDGDGEPIDLAPFSEITFRLKRSVQDADDAALFVGTMTGADILILNPSTDGICEVTIPASAAAQMMLGRPYYWTCSVTNQLGDDATPVYGTLFAESPIQR
jgi:hypothetical protein